MRTFSADSNDGPGRYSLRCDLAGIGLIELLQPVCAVRSRRSRDTVPNKGGSQRSAGTDKRRAGTRPRYGRCGVLEHNERFTDTV